VGIDTAKREDGRLGDIILFTGCLLKQEIGNSKSKAGKGRPALHHQLFLPEEDCSRMTFHTYIDSPFIALAPIYLSDLKQYARDSKRCLADRHARRSRYFEAVHRLDAVVLLSVLLIIGTVLNPQLYV
jgi:hypothetical protein